MRSRCRSWLADTDTRQSSSVPMTAREPLFGLQTAWRLKRDEMAFCSRASEYLRCAASPYRVKIPVVRLL
jgi:hypothetical protein